MVAQVFRLLLRAGRDCLAVALPRCRLLTCDALIADVVRRSRLDTRFRCELFTGAARGHRQAWLPLESL
jgi:hypothetical protein